LLDPRRPPHQRPTLFPYTTLFRSLDELPDAIEKERCNEHEVGHGNQNRQQRCAPPRADPTKSPAPALRPVEFVDCHGAARRPPVDRKSTRLNSSHVAISYAVFCLK